MEKNCMKYCKNCEERIKPGKFKWVYGGPVHEAWMDLWRARRSLIIAYRNAGLDTENFPSLFNFPEPPPTGVMCNGCWESL